MSIQTINIIAIIITTSILATISFLTIYAAVSDGDTTPIETYSTISSSSLTLVLGYFFGRTTKS